MASVRSLAIFTVATCVIAFSASSASADTVTDTADVATVVSLVSDAAPDGARPAETAEADGGFSATTATTESAIPADPSDPIEVHTEVTGRTVSAKIDLPDALDLDAGQLGVDGTVVYPSESDATVAIQALENGDTRVQTIIPDRGATHEATYGLEGYRAVIDSSGQAGFVQKGGAGLYVPVENAWATDATGAPVRTYYEVRGDRLAQIVVPSDTTAYPIVADPTWGWRNAAWGLTLSRSETASIKDYAAASGFCTALVKSKGLAVACGAWASYLQIQAATANRQWPRGCLHIVVAPLPGAISHTYC
ncbi:hypothetical protein [Microbacterium enclense]|uniref:hypothetical protein n=1 Tax=Microbacterium enclense TaxID=993073 RepID=UPI003D703665